MSELKNLKESVDSLVDHVSTQNKLLEGLPDLFLKVGIMWGILKVVGGVVLLGLCGFAAKAMFGS